jgi:two-component system chemotaxis response regulator CheB
LTGLLDDGSAGLLDVKRQGGVAIVQDPTDAQFPDMPRNALAATQVDFCAPLSDIPPLLANLYAEEIPNTMPAIPEMLTVETLADTGKVTPMEQLGKPSTYTCPECAGVLWEIDDKELLRFRCRVGHAFSAEGLAGEHKKLTEDTLWAAARSLEESASFARRLSDRYRTNDLQAAADEYKRRADVDQAHAASIIAALTETTD